MVLQRGDAVIDQVASYFGMRKISLGKDGAGTVRLMLNNRFVFQYGPLDQGWWPDGLYTAPTDEALRYDLETLKRIGCNMLRKHVKVEPDRLYYWCDKLGLLVWQDMPNGDRGIRADQPDLKRSEESARQFELELKSVIDALRSHPSIVMWVPFNEGWGQYDTQRIVAWIKGYDPSRLVNNASGWTDRGVGDVLDIHRYPGPARPAVEADRAIVLGEFGGLGLPLAGHTWQAEKNWGYRSFDDREALAAAYIGLMRCLHPLVGEGLSAAVYTQTTDVEIEINGYLTYDRAVEKLPRRSPRPTGGCICRRRSSKRSPLRRSIPGRYIAIPLRSPATAGNSPISTIQAGSRDRVDSARTAPPAPSSEPSGKRARSGSAAR